jgi:hypothetical protein
MVPHKPELLRSNQTFCVGHHISETDARHRGDAQRGDGEVSRCLGEGADRTPAIGSTIFFVPGSILARSASSTSTIPSRLCYVGRREGRR